MDFEKAAPALAESPSLSPKPKRANWARSRVARALLPVCMVSFWLASGHMNCLYPAGEQQLTRIEAPAIAEMCPQVEAVAPSAQFDELTSALDASLEEDSVKAWAIESLAAAVRIPCVFQLDLFRLIGY